MTTEEPKDARVYYTIGEVADMLGESVSLVRHWEKNFDVIKPTRNKKGNRLFSPQDVKNFKTIRFLVKDQGMTLKGANEKMSTYVASKKNAPTQQVTNDLDAQAEVIDRLRNIKSLLTGINKYL